MTAQLEALSAGFESMCPHVLDNPYIPHYPHPKQLVFLGAHQAFCIANPKKTYQALYGGAAGGGKSDALLMGAAQMAWKYPGSASVLIRRTWQQLIKPDAILDRAMKWWLPAGVLFNAKKSQFRFPNGSVVEMTFHGHPKDDLNFQGARYHYVGWDELTHWPDDRAYRYVVHSRMRRGDDGIPLRSLSTSNPGGPGHVWVKKLFVGGTDATTGRIIIPELPYFPARVIDNPSLDREAYFESMSHLHPTLRDQLRDGDWDAREPGDYFRLEWFGPLLQPEDIWPRHNCNRVRFWDLAASERETACRTAGVRMARHSNGVYAVEHVKAFKKNPGLRDDLIVQTAMADGKQVVVGIEIEPGSGGQAQYETLKKRLKPEGFKVFGARPKADMTDREGKVMFKAPPGLKGKLARWASVSAELQLGYISRGEAPMSDEMEGSPWWGKEADKDTPRQSKGIRLFAGPWVQDFIDEIEGCPPETDDVLVDCADAFAAAYLYLWAHPVAFIPRTPRKAEQLTGDPHDIHPEDRPDPLAAQKTRSGRWKF